MKTRAVCAGGLALGGDSPVRVQTMWKSAIPADPLAIIPRIRALGEMGCELLRFACPGMDEAEKLGFLASALAERNIALPLVADIHFDWRIALRCLDFPIAKIRINPGNIGEAWKVGEVADKAKDKGVPLRIGVNSGSLPLDLRAGTDPALAMVEAAEREMAVLDGFGFEDILVSLKSSDVETTVRANRIFSSRHETPLHLGVTEAGPLIAGVARTTAALASLLPEGIGATIRVSLTDSEESEVVAGREILSALGRRSEGVRIVSCPRCGRNTFDTHAFLERWRDRLYRLPARLSIAIMGCVVNGPGEGAQADIGITGAGDKVLIFRKGKIVRTVSTEDADTEFGGVLDEALSRSGRE
jgi:(E)-4-hydroxy-3-methylbut-2-enyl-diphosphate synthase